MERSSLFQSVILAACVVLCIQAKTAAAQSQAFMTSECESVAQTYYRDWQASSDMRYNGQRVDGSHAINGRIFLENRAEDFACSYDSGGRRMTEFFAEGRPRNAYLPGGGGASGAITVRVAGVPAGDALNVRGGPGTNYRIVGALGNGDRVRKLTCQAQGRSEWCQIEMMTDMRERGWVNARFLTQGGATQLPEPPPSEGQTVVVRGLSSGGRLNVRSGPGTRFGIVGVLGSGDQVRNLGCEGPSVSRWCRIEMLTDMRERGWVSARYLGRGGASQLPGTPPGGSTSSATGRIACSNQVGPTMFDCDFRVVRRGNGSATVVVTYPTGNSRTIYFDRGTPTGSDGSARLSYRRSSDRTEVSIGNVERIRVPNAVIYGG